MTHRTQSLGLAALLFTVTLAGCKPAAPPAPPPAAQVTAERLAKAESEPGQWMTYNGTQSEQRFSRLKAISADNVKSLGLAWFADYDTNLQQAGAPLFIDGVLYVSTAWSKVYAYDARSGKQLWQYDPKVPGEWAAKVCCGLVNRGLAAYQGKIYVGTLDGRLVALDAATGTEAWSTLTFDAAKKDDPLYRYSITMAPRVVKGKVVIGASGGEFSVRGWIAAFDAATGKEAWRFHTVPGNPADGFENEAMKKAAATWSGQWWKLGGGGTVWDAAVYDPSTNLLYFGTGNGTPWNQTYRDPKGGDNLYLASIIALNADTGEYVWHYQTTPADTWDYDAVSPMMTVDISVEGQPRHVLIQPSKNGFYYVLDAATGKLLNATPFTTVNWATGVDLKTGRPKVVAAARYTKNAFNLRPGVQGGHGWHANAYSPDTGLIYVATQDAAFPMVPDLKFTPSTVGYNLGLDFTAPATYYQKNPKEQGGFVGYLQAMDPATGKQVWRTKENQGPTGGALATAGGLVFQGAGSDSEFRAYDAKSGQPLWSFATQTASLAPPISYELDGKQYVAVSVGGAVPGGYFAPNYSRLLVFALDGKATLPPTVAYTPPPLDPPPSTAPADVIAAGHEAYGKYCAACHGQDGQTRGSTFPNLMLTPLLKSQADFDQVVLKGVRSARGMASFAAVLKPEDSVAVREYVISIANQAKANAVPPPPASAPKQAHE